jgi:hypothetical protein
LQPNVQAAVTPVSKHRTVVDNAQKKGKEGKIKTFFFKTYLRHSWSRPDYRLLTMVLNPLTPQTLWSQPVPLSKTVFPPTATISEFCPRVLSENAITPSHMEKFRIRSCPLSRLQLHDRERSLSIWCLSSVIMGVYVFIEKVR